MADQGFPVGRGATTPIFCQRSQKTRKVEKKIGRCVGRIALSPHSPPNSAKAGMQPWVMQVTQILNMFLI